MYVALAKKPVDFSRAQFWPTGPAHAARGKLTPTATRNDRAPATDGCRYRDLNADGTVKYMAITSANERANEMGTSERKDLRNKKANTKMFHT
jgi:hypothetical protein